MHYHPGQSVFARVRNLATRWYVPITVGVVLSACVSVGHTRMGDEGNTRSRVNVLDPLLAQRIGLVAEQSASFRSAWLMIQQSGLRVRIGTERQLHGALPRWYRDHPRDWAGVTVAMTDAAEQLTGAVIVIRLSAMAKAAQKTGSRDYLPHEVDRVLIHEIYGHLVPMVAARDARHECLDQHLPGEVACVELRERQIAAELSHYRLARGAGSDGN